MNSLIPVEQYLKFTRFCDYHNECEIHTFAQSVNVPDFVVIGRLQKDELIDWSHFTKSIPRYNGVMIKVYKLMEVLPLDKAALTKKPH